MRNRHWLPALKALGLDHGRQHDLRHTFCTWLADAGVSMDDIALLVGHSSTWVTQRYRHRAPTYGDKALAALNDVADAAESVIPEMTPKRRLHAVSEPIDPQSDTQRATSTDRK